MLIRAPLPNRIKSLAKLTVSLHYVFSSLSLSLALCLQETSWEMTAVCLFGTNESALSASFRQALLLFFLSRGWKKVPNSYLRYRFCPMVVDWWRKTRIRVDKLHFLPSLIKRGLNWLNACLYPLIRDQIHQHRPCQDRSEVFL